MNRKEDLSGQIINGKRILGVAGVAKDGYHTIYSVECPNCKDIYSAPKSNLLRTKTCYKCCPRTQRGSKHNRWRGETAIPLDYYNSLRRKAQTRKLPFSVSIEFLDKLYFQQNQKCHFTGEFIDFISKTASLDRIDSKKGYIKNNVQWVHKDVNMMKNNRDEQDFIHRCVQIHHYTHQSKPLGLLPAIPPCRHKNFRGNEYIPKDYYTTLKKNAQQRNLEFSVSLEDLNECFRFQSGKCMLTGEDLFFKKHPKQGYKKPGNASLDRIDNTQGYIHGNIQWVHKTVNMIKYQLTQFRLLEICREITKKFTVNVAISGFFQILHVGHIDYITSARKLGGYLTVIVNSDEQAKLKNTPLVVNQNDRAKLISHIRGVDEVCIAIDEDGTVSKSLELLKPQIFCNGGDRKINNSEPKETKTCERLGIKMVYGVGGEKSESSSSILQRAHEILLKKV